MRRATLLRSRPASSSLDLFLWNPSSRRAALWRCVAMAPSSGPAGPSSRLIDARIAPAWASWLSLTQSRSSRRQSPCPGSSRSTRTSPFWNLLSSPARCLRSVTCRAISSIISRRSTSASRTIVATSSSKLSRAVLYLVFSSLKSATCSVPLLMVSWSSSGIRLNSSLCLRRRSSRSARQFTNSTRAARSSCRLTGSVASAGTSIGA